MGTPHIQWTLLKTDPANADAVIGQTVDAAAPVAADLVGVKVSNRAKLTVRCWETFGAGQYDVDVWLQYGAGEPWFKANTAASTVNAVTPALFKVDTNGAVRAFARCYNFAAGATAQVRISGGD